MNNDNDSQRFAKRLLGILGENRWREARWVLVIMGIAFVLFVLKPEFLNKKPSGREMPKVMNP